MSVRVMSWVWHGKECADVAGNELVLLQALADVADDNGRCRFVDDERGLTYEVLAKKARVSERTVVRLMDSLRDRELVEQAKGVKGRPNVFAVLVPWREPIGDNLAPNAEGDSVTAETDSVTSATVFGDKSASTPSYRRTDVGRRGSRAARGIRIPEPFMVSGDMRRWAATEVPGVDVDRSTRMFVDHWRAKTGRDATKLDWVGTWRNWLRRDAGGGRAARPSAVARGLSLVERMDQRDADGEQKAVGS